ncbi:MAG TPA: YceI family protein, partial [Savagea sp.]
MTKWQVDHTHSAVGFTVKHMMVSKVKGQFEQYDATIEADNLEDLTTANITFTIDTASVQTKSEDRDNHLRSEDFFDAANYPQMVFKSTSITGDGEDYEITGDLT